MNELSGVEHLRLGRAALVRQREEIDQAIAAIDAVLVSLGATSLTENLGTKDTVAAKVTPAQPMRTAPESTPTVREAVLLVLHASGQPMKMRTMISEIEKLGVVAEHDSIRSVVGKMERGGKITKVAYGLYAHPEFVAQDAESPVAAGLSDREAARSRREVTADGTTDVDVQDQAWQANHPDHRSGAPVRGYGLVALQ